MRLWASIRMTRPRRPLGIQSALHSQMLRTASATAWSAAVRSIRRGLGGPKARMNPRMKNLIEVSVDSIRIHMPTAQHLVILKEKEADRYLPIWIGSFEAQAIAAKISGNSVGRPLTHDLMANAFGDLGVSIKRIVVTRLADQGFYARLYVNRNGRDLDLHAGPPNAIG